MVQLTKQRLFPGLPSSYNPRKTDAVNTRETARTWQSPQPAVWPWLLVMLSYLRPADNLTENTATSHFPGLLETLLVHLRIMSCHDVHSGTIILRKTLQLSLKLSPHLPGQACLASSPGCQVPLVDPRPLPRAQLSRLIHPTGERQPQILLSISCR